MDISNNENNALKRLAALFDDADFSEIDPYAKGANGEVEVVAGFGYVNGAQCYAFAQNSDVNSGAITLAQCAKIKKVYELATKTGCPVIGVYDSNGVQLTEGFEVLNAYGDIVKSATSVSGVVPQISIVAGACVGISALMANMADVVIATKDSDFYVTAPSEVTVEASAKDGVVDIVANDYDEAVSIAGNLAALLPSNNLCKPPMAAIDYAEPVAVANAASSAEDVIKAIADGDIYVELKKEYGTKVVTALTTVEGSAVGFIAFKGEALCPKCSYKAEAMIKLCDSFNIPVVTVVANDGIKKNVESQVLVSLTKLTSAYAGATVPKISLITTKAIGGAYIVLAGKGANADLTFAWDNAVASPLDIDASVQFLYQDRLHNGESKEALANEYKQTIGSVYTAAACGAVDDVFAPEETRKKIMSALFMLDGKRETTIPRKHSVK